MLARTLRKRLQNLARILCGPCVRSLLIKVKANDLRKRYAEETAATLWKTSRSPELALLKTRMTGRRTMWITRSGRFPNPTGRRNSPAGRRNQTIRQAARQNERFRIQRNVPLRRALSLQKAISSIQQERNGKQPSDVRDCEAAGSRPPTQNEPARKPARRAAQRQWSIAPARSAAGTAYRSKRSGHAQAESSFVKCSRLCFAEQARRPHAAAARQQTQQPHATRRYPYFSVAYMTALMECMRFSASSNTTLRGPSNTSSVTSSSVTPNFSATRAPTSVFASW